MIATAPQSNVFPLLSDAEILDASPVGDWPVSFFCPNGHDFVVTFTDEEEAAMYPVAECETCTAYATTTPFSHTPHIYVAADADALTLAQSRRTAQEQEQALADAGAFAAIAASLPMAG